MATYTSCEELKGKVLAEDDEVIICGMTYKVRHNYLCASSGYNDRIFEFLGLKEEEFCRRMYGYTPDKGVWPCSREMDFEALTRCVLGLYLVAEFIQSLHERVTKSKAVVDDTPVVPKDSSIPTRRR